MAAWTGVVTVEVLRSSKPGYCEEGPSRIALGCFTQVEKRIRDEESSKMRLEWESATRLLRA